MRRFRFIKGYFLSSFNGLSEQIQHCLFKDRFYLQRELKSLSVEDISANSDAYKKLLGRIEQSQNQVASRKHCLNLACNLDLPVSQNAERIVKAIKKHQVVVVAGETGSGKTTQLPKLCMQAGQGIYGRIAHTQPRRIAARSVAERICEEVGCELGSAVGYQVRFEEHSSKQANLTLMTDGILLAATAQDRFLNEFDTIIIDEAHERSLNIDFLLGFLKQLLPKRPDLKLIITSATIDVERFSKHFNDAPIIEVSGRSYPVEVQYHPLFNDDPEEADASLNESVLAAVEHSISLDKVKGNTGDVLVFLPGEREIRQCAEVLRKAQLKQVEIQPLYARLSKAEQQKIFNPSGQSKRVVLATNVAETSLTVPGIRYVIDSGLARISRYSFRNKVQRLPIEAISKASANQRAGRCGRVEAGVCLRLYSEEDFNGRDDFSEPEIQRTNLAAVILRMKQLKLGDVTRFPFLDAPDSRFLNDGIKSLQELEALNAKQNLTALGRKMASFPVDPRVSRIILEAQKHKALEPILIIASGLNIQDPKERPSDKQQAADEKHALFKHKESDFLSWLNLWNAWEQARLELSSNQLRKWAKQHFLSYMRMREWRDTHRQLVIQCKQLSLDVHTNNLEYEAIHKSLLAGFITQVGRKQDVSEKTAKTAKTERGERADKGEYEGTRNKRFLIFPSSSQAKRKPKWILADEMVETSRLFARTVAQIEPQWIEELAKPLLKYQHFEPHFRQKTGQVTAYEQSMLYGLVIHGRKPVNYSRVDEQAAHEIYIRQALVEQQSQSRVRFYEQNKLTLKEVAKLEEKSRRRDLVIDDEALVSFYLQRIPNNISSDNHLVSWYKKLNQAQQQELLFTHEFLLHAASQEVTDEDFPNELQHQGLSFPLSYSFAPNTIDDGVSLSAPVAMLEQIPKEQIQWLVPGLLENKIIALLKGLPKETRKQLVPVPNSAREFLSQANKTQPMLMNLLSFINQRVYPKIDIQVLENIELEPHLLMNIRLKEGTKILAQSRNLDELKQRFKSQSQQAVNHDFDTSLQQKDLQNWPKQAIPRQLEKDSNGLKIRVYPHLEAQAKKVVDLNLSPDPIQSKRKHQLGVVMLIRKQLATQENWAKKHIQQTIKPHLLKAKGLSDEKSLIEDITQAAFYHQFAPDLNQLPYTEDEFKQCLERRQNLDKRVEELTTRFISWLHLRHDILKQASKSLSLERAMACSDIQSHLNGLMAKGFMLKCSWQQLGYYERYFKAMNYRLDKLSGNLPRDRALMLEYDSIAEAFFKKTKDMDLVLEPEYHEFFWLLQEWRVGLFAQPLGTAEPVSQKRLRQRWQNLTGE